MKLPLKIALKSQLSSLENSLFFLILLFLPTQLGKHFWPEFSLIYSLKIDYYSPTIYFWDLILIFLIGIWLIARPKVNTKALTVLLVFLLSQAISLFFANNIGAGLVRLEQYLIISLFALFISSQSLPKIQAIFIKPVIIFSLFEVFLSMLQLIKGGSVGLWLFGERDFSLQGNPTIAKFDWFGQVFLRPYGTFSHPNVMAGFLVIILPLIVFFNHSKLKIINLCLVGLSIIISFSRGALIVLILESFVFFRRKLKILFIFLGLAAPLVIIRFLAVLNFDSLSLLRREELAEVAVALFVKSPIFGIGLNNFISQSAQTTLIAGPSRFLQPVHNIFLLNLAETGTFGTIGLLVLVFIAIYKLYKDKSQFSRVLIFCWLGIFFLGFFDHYFLTLPQGQRLFFLVWGLSMLE